MKKVGLLKEKATDLVIALLFVLCILIVAFIHCSPGYGSLTRAINSFFILQPNSVTEERIDGYAGVRRTYAFDMSRQPDNNGRSWR